MKTTTSLFYTFVLAATLCCAWSTQSMPLQLALAGANATSMADLFASSTASHKSFVIPDTPHFRHFYDFTGPRKYNALYTTDAGKMTLGGFLRFISKSAAFFNEQAEQKAYTKALSAAVSAHKNYKARPTERNKASLLAAQDHVLELLTHIQLSRPVCTKLEVILSKTPSRGRTVVNALIFPWRASLSHNPVTDEFTIDQGNGLLAPIKAVGRTMVHGLTAFAFVVAADTALLWSVPTWCLAHSVGLLQADIIAGKAIMLSSSIATTVGSFTQYKLAPEPLEGVRVLVNRSPDDASAINTPPVLDTLTEAAAAAITPGPGHAAVAKTIKLAYGALTNPFTRRNEQQSTDGFAH